MSNTHSPVVQEAMHTERKSSVMCQLRKPRMVTQQRHQAAQLVKHLENSAMIWPSECTGTRNIPLSSTSRVNQNPRLLKASRHAVTHCFVMCVPGTEMRGNKSAKRAINKVHLMQGLAKVVLTEKRDILQRLQRLKPPRLGACLQ